MNQNNEKVVTLYQYQRFGEVVNVMSENPSDSFKDDKFRSTHKILTDENGNIISSLNSIDPDKQYYTYKGEGYKLHRKGLSGTYEAIAI